MNELIETTSDERGFCGDWLDQEMASDVAAAEEGVVGNALPLPYGQVIGELFGNHDVDHLQATIGGSAAAACDAMDANAYALEDQLAFSGTLVCDCRLSGAVWNPRLKHLPNRLDLSSAGDRF